MCPENGARCWKGAASLHSVVPIEGLCESVDGRTRLTDGDEQFRTDLDIDNPADALESIALLDETIVTGGGGANVIGLQIETHYVDTEGEFCHLLS